MDACAYLFLPLPLAVQVLRQQTRGKLRDTSVTGDLYFFLPFFCFAFALGLDFGLDFFFLNFLPWVDGLGST